jgi:acetolactate synthase-1/2/3 large subunit
MAYAPRGSEQREALASEAELATSQHEITVGARIADFLRNEQIDHIFSICDVTYNQVHKRAVEIGIEIVAPRHEAAGVHMADGLSRMTGRPQVAMAGMGPGVANLVPGVACANIENIPVIVIATQRTRSTHSAVRRGRFQYTPQIRMFEPITKWTKSVESANRIDEVLREAFRLATTGRPGPVYIEVPSDVMLETRDFPDLVRPESYRLPPQACPDASIEAAAALLAEARLPMILAGTGVHTSRAHRDLQRLAELLQCPVTGTPGGRGALPATHPLWFQLVGIEDTLATEADCVLAIGTSVGEPIDFGEAPSFAGADKQSWIQVERDATAIGVNRRSDVPLVGDLRVVVPQLIAALEKRGPFEARPRVTEYVTGQHESFAAVRAQLPDTSPVHPARAIREMREVLPDDAVLALDGGSTGLWESIGNEQRSNDFLWTSKFGHLGTGFPYAIAAQIAVGPERRVCLVTGDSAFGFYTMELETAVRHNLPVLVVVNGDQHWGMEYEGQLAEIGRHVECETSPVRLDRLAESLGAHGEYVTTTAEMAPAVERALASGKPAVVHVATDAIANANPPGLDGFDDWYAGNY